MQRKKRSFVVHDEQGRPYTINDYVTVTRTVTLDGTTHEHEGPGDLRLANGGGLVNRLGSNKFLVLDTGAVLTATAPDAE